MGLQLQKMRWNIVKIDTHGSIIYGPSKFQDRGDIISKVSVRLYSPISVVQGSIFTDTSTTHR